MFIIDDIQVRRYRIRGEVPARDDKPGFDFSAGPFHVLTAEDMDYLRQQIKDYKEMFDLKDWEITVEMTQDKWERVKIDGTD